MDRPLRDEVDAGAHPASLLVGRLRFPRHSPVGLLERGYREDAEWFLTDFLAAAGEQPNPR